MKKIFFWVVVFTHMAQISVAQNTFPISGNVGVGIVSPSVPLDVMGTVKIQSSNNNYILISVPEIGIEGEIQVNETNFFTQELEIKGWFSVSPEAYLCQVRLILQ